MILMADEHRDVLNFKKNNNKHCIDLIHLNGYKTTNKFVSGLAQIFQQLSIMR